ncbi:hypothetical protein RvY_07217 [Ramazzottius varieornatus]|uniref:Uncharacterized protein n=1 Tax=Ramazzottius varieornatus TaxID=947166 RepID=A0A1D1V3Z4_RAMVA|nr:hypothetical protein RvY_07217 [Ramazzottius varieornatus]
MRYCFLAYCCSLLFLAMCHQLIFVLRAVFLTFSVFQLDMLTLTWTRYTLSSAHPPAVVNIDVDQTTCPIATQTHFNLYCSSRQKMPYIVSSLAHGTLHLSVVQQRELPLCCSLTPDLTCPFSSRIFPSALCLASPNVPVL